MFNYVVTANKASAVTNSVSGNFLGPNEVHLITAKLSRIEISKASPEGLKTVHEVGLFGRIDSIKSFKQQGCDKDLLFVLTNKYHVSILEFIEGPQSDTIDVVTRKSGNIADPASRPAEGGNIVMIDPNSKMIGLRLHDGLLKVIPIEKNKSAELEAFNIRMEEINISDIAFLHGYNNPTIAFIYKEHSSSTCHVKTYEISLREREIVQGPWSRENVANEASIIIPVAQRYGGVIVIALESIVYLNGDQEKTIAPPLMKQSPINCYAKIDDSRYLLGDLSGKLFCLELQASNFRPDHTKLEVEKMSFEYLGEVSSPECITYLDNDMVHIGSRLGDSQLIKLYTNPRDEDATFIKICETYANVGPISDMCLVDLEKQGQGQLVTCSGFGKDGSIRIIRNGIGINESCVAREEQIKGVWSLKIGDNQKPKDDTQDSIEDRRKDSDKDNHILVTYKDGSSLWYCEEKGDFDAGVSQGGFDNQRTVLCANVAHSQIVQVTTKAIRLISSIDKQLIDVWTLPGKDGMHVASNNDTHIVCAYGKILYYFEIQPNKLHLLSETELEFQISALDISPLTPGRQLLSVGFWFTKNLIIYNLPDLRELHRAELPTEESVMPRSILTIKLDETYYLFCAMGDGVFFYFLLDPIEGKLSNRKKLTLGVNRITLRPFKSKSTTSVFVCSDRPTVIYSSNNKLVFSNVNLKDVKYMCSLNTSFYSDSLALVTDQEIIFGTVDEIQKLHIKTVPLDESPIKIAHQQSTQTFGILTARIDTPDINGLQPLRPSASTRARSESTAIGLSGLNAKPLVVGSDAMEVDTYSLLIIDQHTFEVLHAHKFMPTEQAASILSAKLGESEEEYYIVGTAFVNQDEPEPKQGRIVVFKWSEASNLQQIAELSIKGCCYCLCEFQNNKFLAGINASVNLIELNSRRDLHTESNCVNATIAVFMKRHGDLILMGDLMRSMSLFTYKPLQAHFEDVARDTQTAWLTGIEILDEEHFMGADHCYNIFICKRDLKATTEPDNGTLQQVSSFHVGDAINVFHPGSLVVQHPSESNINIKGATLFGTVDGVVGLILTIDEDLFKMLESMQNVLVHHVKSVGKISHSDWRSFVSGKHVTQSSGFIDGDLVEAFLDLPRDKMLKVAEDAQLPLDELLKTVEELSRLH